MRVTRFAAGISSWPFEDGSGAVSSGGFPFDLLSIHCCGRFRCCFGLARGLPEIIFVVPGVDMDGAIANFKYARGERIDKGAIVGDEYDCTR